MTFALSVEEPLAPPLPFHRFTVEQYHRLGELGILTPEDQVELLEGWIVRKMNQRPIHSFIVRSLNECFMRQLPQGWICQCQLPVTTANSEPEPDVAILKGEQSDFRGHHPSGRDCRLLIEVADTSLERDRAKASIYRLAGVQEYWIINVGEKVIERFVFSTSPNTEPQIVRASESLAIQIGEGVIALDLTELFA